MATLFNTKISATYPGLIKTIDNIAISATLRQLTDGSGNSSGLFLNNAGDFKVTSILEWGSLKDTGTGVTITQFVTAANGIANFNNDTTIPTSAAVKTYVDAVVTASDLDFKGDSGTGEVDLDSQILEIAGTTNEITTLALNQKLTIGLPNSVTISGTYTGATFLGDLNGTINTATTATTQSAGTSNSTVATTKFVMDLDSGSDLDFSGDSGTGDVTLNTQVLAITGTTNQIVTTAANQGLSLSLPSTVHRNLQGNVIGNVDGNLTGNVAATSVLVNGVTATSQSSSDSSTKVATTAYVKGLNNASDLDFTTDSGSGAVVLNTETFSVLGTTNQINSAGTGQAITLSLPSTIHRNLLGNVTGDLTGNADTATAWETARNLSVTGEATGTLLNVNGTQPVSGAVTLDNNSVTGKVLTGLPTPAASTVLPADSILDGIGKLQSQINGLANGLQFQGGWNATANSPLLGSGGGEAASGTTSSTTANKLVDSNANFTSTVTVGDKVINQVDRQTSLVTNIDSNTILSLASDIMLTGEAYTIDNSPFITQGHYYVVNEGGSTNLNGISNWSVGDWVIAGATNVWEKLDHTDVEGTGTPGNIPKWLDVGTLQDSIMAESGATITVTGSLSTTTNLNSGSNFAVNTNKFTANGTTGNVAILGDLAINTNKFTVNATSGNTLAAGTMTSPTFLGDLNGTINTLTTAVTQSANNNSTKVATTAYVDTSAGLYLPLAGGTLTGSLNITGGTTHSLNITTSGTQDTIKIDRAANDDNAIIKYQTASTDKWIVGLRNTGDDNFRFFNYGTSSDVLILDTSGNATFAGIVTAGSIVGAASTFDPMVTITYSDISTGENRGLRIVNTQGTEQIWNLTNGITGNNNEDFCIRDSTNNVNAFTLAKTSGNATFAGNVAITKASSAAELTLTGGSDSWTFDTYYTDNKLFIKSNGAGGTVMTLLGASGNIGIGTDSPSSRLTVNKTKSGTGVENYDLIRLGLLGTGAVGDSSTIGWFSTTGTKTAGIEGISGLDNILYGELAFHVRRFTTDSYDRVMTINNRGNVGIGTNLPSTKLHIGGTAPGDSIIRQDSTASGTNWEIGERSAGKWQIFEDDTDSVVATFMSSGNVGIGNLNPSHQLDISGAGANDGVIHIKNTTSSYYPRLAIQSDVKGYHIGVGGSGAAAGYKNDLYFYDNNEAEIRMRIDSLGQVGIGAPELPTNVYTASGGGYAMLGLGQSSFLTAYKADDSIELCQNTYLNTSGVYQGVTANVRGALLTMVDGQFIFATHITAADKTQTVLNVMKLSDAGDVLFSRPTKTSTPTYGNAYISGDYAVGATNYYAQLFIEHNSVTNHGIVLKEKNTSGGIQLAFLNSNVTLIGQIVTSATATSYQTSSDYRLKEDLQDFKGLDMVSKIPVYDFKWKADESRSYGVIAHELQEVLPDAVSGDKDAEDMQGVDYSKIVPLLVKSIQELTAKVERLEQECKCK